MSEAKYKALPPVLKHCTLAIFNSGKVKGTEASKWSSAWLMACSQLTKLGFLVGGSESGNIDNIAGTGKVSPTSKKVHTAEGRQKNVQFDSRIWMLMQNETIRNVELLPQSKDAQMDSSKKVFFDDKMFGERTPPQSRQEKRIQDPTKKKK